MEDQAMISRIKSLIAETGLTDTAYAQSVGLDPNKLAKCFGAAGRNFTTLELAKIADHASRSIDWILTGTEPRLPAVAARRDVESVLDADADLAVSVARRYGDADQVLQLIGAPGYPPQVTVPEPSAALHKDQGEELAGWTWEHLRSLGQQDLSDLPEIMEQIFGIDTAIMPLPTGYSGLSWVNGNFRLAIAVPESIPWRQRFTLAHELCHVLMGDSADLHLDLSPANDRGLQVQPIEIRANAFAAALLAPAHLIRSLIEPSALVTDEHFPFLVTRLGISPGPLLRRLARTGLAAPTLDVARWSKTTGPACAHLADMYDSFGEQATTSLGVRPPARLARQMIEAYQGGLVGIRPLATLAQMRVEDALAVFDTEDVQLDDDGVRVA